MASIGPVSMDGVDAHEAGVDDTRPRREAEGAALSAVITRTAAAVADLRGRARGVDAVGASHRLEPGEALERGLAEAAVAGDVMGGARGLALVVDVGGVDLDDLGAEATLGPGLGRPLLRGEAELVAVGG